MKFNSGLIFALGFAARLAAAQDNSPYASQPWGAGQGSARAAALSGALDPADAGISSVFLNPAQAPRLRGAQFGLEHIQGLEGLRDESAAYAGRLAEDWGLGLKLSLQSSDTIEGRDEFGNRAADYSTQDARLGLVLGRSLGKSWSLGAGLRGGALMIGGASALNFEGQLGISWAMSQGLSAGLSYNGIGGGISTATLGWLDADLGWDLGPSGWPLCLAGGLEGSLGGAMRAKLSLQWTLLGALALRGGAAYDPSALLADSNWGFSGGMGFKLGSAGLDYAIQPQGALGLEQRLGLSYGFGAGDAAAKTQASAVAPGASGAGAAAPGSAEEKESSVSLADAAVSEPKFAASSPSQSQMKLRAENEAESEAEPEPMPEPTPKAKLAGEKLRPGLSASSHAPRIIDTAPAPKAGLELYFEKDAAAPDAEENALLDRAAADASNALAWRALGNYYFKKGRKKDAINAFERVLKLAPGEKTLARWLETYRNHK